MSNKRFTLISTEILIISYAVLLLKKKIHPDFRLIELNLSRWLIWDMKSPESNQAYKTWISLLTGYGIVLFFYSGISLKNIHY